MGFAGHGTRRETGIIGKDELSELRLLGAGIWAGLGTETVGAALMGDGVDGFVGSTYRKTSNENAPTKQVRYSKILILEHQQFCRTS